MSGSLQRSSCAAALVQTLNPSTDPTGQAVHSDGVRRGWEPAWAHP